MKTIKGNYTDAIVYADIVDETTLKQIKTLIDQEFMTGAKVRIMADCHAGAGCVIGTTIEVKDKVVPNLVGVDIGCGMLTIKLGKTMPDLPTLDAFIHANIPAGMHVNDEVTPCSINIEDLRCSTKLREKAYLEKSIGSLGGGNHFIEIDVSSEGDYYLVIHTGSRNLGKQVAEIYQHAAVEYHQNKFLNKKEEAKRIISEYKATGRQKEIQNALNALEAVVIKLNIPEDLCYLEGALFEDYMHDMDLAQRFAKDNRREIARRITSFLGLELSKLESFDTIHNYINMNDHILRKGSISAYDGELVLIPINMRDGSIIARGKSNEDYNFSAPHGAGRVMSRSEAIRTVSLKDFEDSMKGIYSSTVNESTIDESPFAYKPIESILDNIKDTVEVVDVIKPVYNFKASE